MQTGKRKFSSLISIAIAVLFTTTILPAQSAEKNTQYDVPPVIHMVCFWLKNPDSTKDKKMLIDGLNNLRDIPQIQVLHIGTPASTESRDVIDSSYQVSELMMFNSVEDQNAYQTHPIHKEFVANYSHLWQKVVVYDSVSAL